MDFFARQERSRRTTRFLVVAFLLAFAAIVLTTTAVTAVVVGVYSGDGSPLSGGETLPRWLAEHGALLGLVAAGTLLLMTLASLYRTASLARGGGQVARMLGGTEIAADTTDPLRRRLLNVVEEMAIASGLPVPDVYVLEEEPAINAFAAGLTPSDAAIAVTRGALERLDRAELQGVVAHEVSHIVNGDMRLNQRLMGLSFGVLVLSLIGRWLLRAARFRRRGRNGGGAAAAFALGAAFMLIGAVGLFASRLIKAAVSRQREMLADASAVQFTRESAALASALKKIGGYTARLTSVDGEEVAHMLFERGSRAFSGWFATHPPLVERIRALDPSFDPRSLEGAQAASASRASADTTVAGISADSPAAGVSADSPDTGLSAHSTAAVGLQPPAAGVSAHSPAPLAARAAVSMAGRLDDSLLERAGRIESPAVGGLLRAALPAELLDAAHSRDSSLLLVLALALSEDHGVRAPQRALLDAQLGAARAALCERLRLELSSLEPKLRIPVLELAMPRVKQRPAEQLEYLLDLVERVTALAAERRLFDYVLLRMLAAYLTDLPEAALGKPHGGRTTPQEALRTLLAACAWHGHDAADTAHRAYRAGLAAAAAAGPRNGAPAAGDAADGWRHEGPPDFTRLDAALLRLKRLRPDGKRAVLRAVLATIRHDRRIEVDELELFRAIAATLGCPLPPMLATGDMQ